MTECVVGATEEVGVSLTNAELKAHFDVVTCVVVFQRELSRCPLSPSKLNKINKTLPVLILIIYI